jgi:5-formyltetrahydrofolate cyclo-ligase
MTDPIGPLRTASCMSGGEVHGDVEGGAKWALRRRLIAARRAVPAAVRQAEAAALAAAALAGGTLLPGRPGPVCAYWPVGGEPGSPELLENLTRRGCQVLLPRVDPPGLDPRGPLNWAEYTGTGSLRAGPLGLLEPSGSALGCPAIATAVLVLVPALAVDWRGIRLGRGGGHYDRTLPLAAPGTPLVAIVRDDEVLASVPAQPHDVPVTAALTPQRGLFPLG